MALAVAGAASAQSASSTASPFKAGFGGLGLSGLEQPVAASAFNPAASYAAATTDGVTQTGSDQSVYSRQRVGGASDSYSGVGSQGGGAGFGGHLNVGAPSGDPSANSALNGKVNLDDGQ